MKKVRKHSKKQNMATYIWEGVAAISVCIMLMLLPGILEYHRDVRLSKRALELEERTKADRYCELTVPDSDINFPVLRCEDNQKYLHTTYTGEENELGAIFLDYRCDLEDNPHNIIYGHDAQDVDGTRLMFGTLRNYLDEEFIQNHPMIKITRGGEVKEYELFAVKVTDTDDEAYRLDFDDGEFEEFADAMGAPANTVEILTLSTCLGNEDDLRLLVQGAIAE